MSRIPDVGNPWLDAGIVPYSTMKLQHGPRRTGRSGSRPTSSPRASRPVPQLVLRHPGDEHDDGGRRAAVQGAARPRPGARPERRRDAQVARATPSSSTGRPTRAMSCSVERNPKLTVEAQAKKDLPAGYSRRATRARSSSRASRSRWSRASTSPIGADVMRWMYCRQQPGGEHQLRPRPGGRGAAAASTSSCGTATPSSATTPALDGFDPTAPQVPVAQRPRHRPLDPVGPAAADRDGARRRSSEYNVMAFCLEAERFVDVAKSPATAFAISTRGDWMLEGQRGERADAIPECCFAAPTGSSGCTPRGPPQPLGRTDDPGAGAEFPATRRGRRRRSEWLEHGGSSGAAAAPLVGFRANPPRRRPTSARGRRWRSSIPRSPNLRATPRRASSRWRGTSAIASRSRFAW